MKIKKFSIKPVKRSDIESRLSDFFDTRCKLFIRFYHSKKNAGIFQMTKIFFHYRGQLNVIYTLKDFNGIVDRIKLDQQKFIITERSLLNNLKFELKQTSIHNRKMLDGTIIDDRQLTYIKSIDFENIVDEIYNIFRLYDTYLLEDKKIINTIDDVNL
jgi:hypothetical protein